MASQLYDSVMRNDAKRDALRNKTPAKPGMHPRGGRDYTRRMAAKAGKQALVKDERPKAADTVVAKSNGNGASESAAAARGRAAASKGRQQALLARDTVKPDPEAGPVGAAKRRLSLGGPGGGSRGTVAAATTSPSNVAKKVTEQPKATKVAVRSGDNPPSPRSALGPQRPAGGSGSFIGSVADYVGKTVKSNQVRYDNAVKDRIRSGREAGPSTPRGQAAAATTPKPGATTKPAPTKIANPGKPKGGKVAVARRSAAPANPPAVPPSKPTAFGSPSTAPVTPKRDVAALQARSKQSLADSQAAAAAHKNGPGGGASTVLAAYRGDTSHFKKREK